MLARVTAGLNRVGRVVYSMSVSLDGFVETAERSLDWVRVDEELHSFFNEEARGASAFLYGRRLYEVMAGYWPTAGADPTATPAMREFAGIWMPMPKVVFSRTLDQVGWNSRLVRGDPVHAVAGLRAQPGFEMSVGGPTLAATLLRHRLIDEVRLYVNPVVLGAGTPFLPPVDKRIELDLLETRRFGSGVVSLRYAVVSPAA